MDYKNNNFCLVFCKKNRDNLHIFPLDLISDSRKCKYIKGYGPVSILQESKDWNYLQKIKEKLTARLEVSLTSLAELQTCNQVLLKTPETNDELQTIPQENVIESVVLDFTPSNTELIYETNDYQGFETNSDTMLKLHIIEGQNGRNLDTQTPKETSEGQAKPPNIIETSEQAICSNKTTETNSEIEIVFHQENIIQPVIPNDTELLLATNDKQNLEFEKNADMCTDNSINSDSDIESEPYKYSGSKYVPSDTDNDESPTTFKDITESNSKKRKRKYIKPSHCKRLFSENNESEELPSPLVDLDDFETSAGSQSKVEIEDSLEYTDDNIVRFTTEGAHKSVIKTNKNLSSFECKRVCDKKSCITNNEMIISRKVIENGQYVIRYATCVGQGAYEGVEYFTGENSYVAVLKKKKKNINEEKKKNFCLFCEKSLIDLTHHLKRQHADEPRVLEALNCSKNSLERNRLLRKIRNDGNRKYEDRIGIKSGAPSRVAVKTKNPEYLLCKNCNGNFISYNYSRHVRNCRGLSANYRHHVKEARIEQMSPNNIYKLNEKLVTELLKPLRYDDERLLIETDVALQAYASYYAVSANMTQNKSRNVRAQLRLLAKLLMRIQCIDPMVPGYPDILTIQKYDLLLLGVMSLVGYKISSNTFEKSFTPLVLKSCLINLARALKFYYHKTSKGTPEEMNELDLFLENFGKKYTQDVTKAAYQVNANLKVLKTSPLPTNEDIAVFAAYVEKQAEEAYTALSSSPFTYKDYLKLGKSVLLMLLILNRRRIGETSRITLQCYNQRERVTPEIERTLTIMEKQLANHLRVVKLVGKRLRELTILISEKHERYLDLFVSLRENAGVDGNNIYLFAAPNSLKFIDASSTLRKFAIKCGAKEPQKLRATLFRKQVATMAQMMHLSDNEIQQLADFMGHTVDVHKEHYRKNCNYQQIVLLSRLFMALEAGDIERFKNKTLTDMEIILGSDENFPWLEDDPQSASECANPSEPDQETHNLIEEIADNFVADNLGAVTEVENLEMSPSTSGHCVVNPNKSTPSPRSRAVKAVMGSPEKSPFKKKRPFKAEELSVLEKYLSVFIHKGEYPPHPSKFYQKILDENRDVFHHKRTTRTIHSYVQNKIRKTKYLKVGTKA